MHMDNPIRNQPDNVSSKLVCIHYEQIRDLKAALVLRYN